MLCLLLCFFISITFTHADWMKSWGKLQKQLSKIAFSWMLALYLFGSQGWIECNTCLVQQSVHSSNYCVSFHICELTSPLTVSSLLLYSWVTERSKHTLKKKKKSFAIFWQCSTVIGRIEVTFLLHYSGLLIIFLLHLLCHMVQIILRRFISFFLKMIFF